MKQDTKMANSQLSDYPDYSAKIFASSFQRNRANEIADRLIRRGWSAEVVVTRRTQARDTKRQAPERDKSANIVLMDRHLYVEDRVLFNAIGGYCDQNFQNIFIISLDTLWRRVDNDSVAQIFSKSFVSEFDRQLIDGLAQRIERRAAHSVRAFSSAVFNQLISSFGSEHRVILRSDTDEDGRFELHTFRGALQRENDYILVIYDDSSLAKSHALIESEVPEVNGARLTVVRPSSGTVLSLVEKKNTQKLFPEAQCFSFEEFHGEDLSSRPTLERQTFDDEIFVDADCTIAIRDGNNTTLNTNKISAKFEIDSVLDRVQADAISKVNLIQAPGGTGKSHLVRYANDQLVDRKAEVVFLDAQLIRECLHSEGYQNLSIRSLYDIYRLCADHSSQSRSLTEERFRLRFKLRDTAIIVDGLEEIYALLGANFDVDALLTDCIGYLEDNVHGIILFTSRKDFWKDAQYDKFRVINLYSFSLENSATYFRELFGGDVSRVTQAQAIVGVMANSEKLVLPLYCDIVGRMLVDLSTIEAAAQVQISPQDRFADLLFWVIQREMERTNSTDWETEGSIRFLEELAFDSIGRPLSLKEAKQILSNTLGRELSYKDVGALETHKLLHVDGNQNVVSHRYPFVETSLTARYIARLLNEAVDSASGMIDEESAVAFNEVLQSSALLPGSELSEALISELSRVNPDGLRAPLMRAFNPALEKLIGETPDQGPLSPQRNLVNNVFYILLKLFSKNFDDPAENTLILKECFDVGGGEYSGVTLFGYAQAGELSVAFDFSDMTIASGLFVDYPDFWKCGANERTKFRDCLIRRCERQASKDAGLALADFSNSEIDGGFTQTLRSKTESKERRRAQIVKALKVLFKGTAPNQNYHQGRVEEEFFSEITIPGPIKFKDLKKTLLESGLLIEFDPGDGLERRLKVPEKFHSHVKQFVSNSVPSPRIKKLIDALL